jgi:16S rRNA (adenine1518-N6/adenine1519-N6)-dimethyltransferase
MMQAEVARRLTAAPGGRDHGVLSVLIQARCRVERVCTVRPGAFLPPPRVDSAVVALHPREDAVILAPSAVALVKELFGERRKQIGGLLRRHHGLAPADVETLARELSIDPRRRAEDLDLSEFVALDAWLARRRERA